MITSNEVTSGVRGVIINSIGPWKVFAGEEKSSNRIIFANDFALYARLNNEQKMETMIFYWFAASSLEKVRLGWKLFQQGTPNMPNISIFIDEDQAQLWIWVNVIM